MIGLDRPTIGVMTGGVEDDFSIKLTRGIMKQARIMNVNVIVLPGKFLDMDYAQTPDLMYDYQYNTLFDLATAESVDGLVIALDVLGCMTTQQRMQDFLKRFEHIPYILAASSQEGSVSVNFDNFSGVKEGLDYLIDELYMRDIGMIGGPNDISDVVERKKTFFEVMASYGIDVESRRYTEVPLKGDCSEIISRYLDHNPDIEAIFCVTDEIAIQLYDEMKKRNLIPGIDISVLGFDNLIWSAKANPSLSTVMADAEELGAKALMMAVAKSQGELVESVKIPTRFILRNSIASSNFEKKLSGEDIEQRNIAQYYEDVFYQYKHSDNRMAVEQTKQAFSGFFNSIRAYMRDPEFGETAYESIMINLSQILLPEIIDKVDISNFMSILKQYHKTLKGQIVIEQEKTYLAELFAKIYAKLVQVSNQWNGVLAEKEIQENYDMKLFVQKTLQFEKGSDLNYTSLLSKLDWLGINDAYILKLEKPVIHLEGEIYNPPKYMLCKAISRRNKVGNLPANMQKVSVEKWFRGGNNFLDRRFTQIALPLYSGEMLYGFFICDMTMQLFDNGEFVCNQLSEATRMIELLKSNSLIQQKLEESLSTLKANNIMLDNLSRKDVLTDIYNRRGFFDAAEEMKQKAFASDCIMQMIFVDMNNLKIINDKFGHDDGDFALKTIADILQQLMGKSGICGRIGGDEFACALPLTVEDEKWIDRINQAFDNFNNTCDKPYYVAVSAGIYCVAPENDISLENALSMADEKLYEMKKHKKKNVLKELSK